MAHPFAGQRCMTGSHTSGLDYNVVGLDVTQSFQHLKSLELVVSGSMHVTFSGPGRLESFTARAAETLRVKISEWQLLLLR